MIEQLIQAAIAIVVAILASTLFYVGSNFILDRFLTSDHIPDDEGRQRRDAIREGIRPWVFIGPALLILGFYLVFPVFKTLQLSFFGRFGDDFVGFSNYVWAFNDPGFRISIRNNILWLIFVPAMSTGFGLLIAYLTDRIWWGQIARSLIFLPMAISFVGASVIWKFVYDYRGSGDQIGILNAFIVSLGFEPQNWISMLFANNFFLMAILIWIQTGFAMVLLGAAIRGVPEDTIEAANMEGATEWQMLTKIVIPQIMGTIVVVWTTITVLVLKVYDIVAAMTNGQWETEVLANLMYRWILNDGGRSSAIAVIIMISVIPLMWWNVRQARQEHN